MVEIAVLFNLVTLIFMHLRYNLWQMIILYSMPGCVRTSVPINFLKIVPPLM